MSTKDLKGSYQLQLRALGGAGFQKVLALVGDLRLFKNRKIHSVLSRPLVVVTFILSDDK